MKFNNFFNKKIIHPHNHRDISINISTNKTNIIKSILAKPITNSKNQRIQHQSFYKNPKKKAKLVNESSK